MLLFLVFLLLNAVDASIVVAVDIGVVLVGVVRVDMVFAVVVSVC